MRSQRLLQGTLRRLTAATLLVSASVAAASGCGLREPIPPGRPRDARFGFLAGEADRPSAARLCQRWMTSAVARDEHALFHVSFPETNPQASCFVPVRHDGDDVAVPAGDTPRGCGFPSVAAHARIEQTLAELDRVARDASGPSRFFDCGLSAHDKRAAAVHNASVLRALLASGERYPYAAIVVPGHGLSAQGKSKLVEYKPGAPCVSVPPDEHAALGGMMPRSRRASALLRGNVAPLAIVSGNAVHSVLNESFAMLHLMGCPRSDVPERYSSVPAERVLLEPCADHTHTNLRNAGRWIDAIGGRAGYVITDDFIQSKYFQDQGGFELLLGSIDQRSLRDWGYVIGSWRQASIGLDAGFWFTPYRFWAEPRDALGSVTCVGVD